MAKMKVHELAKELDKQSKELIAFLKEKGVEVKVAQSSIEGDAIELVRNHFGNKSTETKQEKSTKPSTEKNTDTSIEETDIKKAEIKTEIKTEKPAEAAPKKKKNIIFVKKLAFFRFIQSVDLIGILKFFNFQSIYQNRIRIADAVVLRNRNSCIRFVRLRMEQKQRTAGRSVGADRKTDTSRNHIRSVHSKKARPHIKATNILQRL